MRHEEIVLATPLAAAVIETPKGRIVGRGLSLADLLTLLRDHGDPFARALFGAVGDDGVPVDAYAAILLLSLGRNGLARVPAGDRPTVLRAVLAATFGPNWDGRFPYVEPSDPGPATTVDPWTAMVRLAHDLHAEGYADPWGMTPGALAFAARCRGLRTADAHRGAVVANLLGARGDKDAVDAALA